MPSHPRPRCMPVALHGHSLRVSLPHAALRASSPIKPPKVIPAPQTLPATPAAETSNRACREKDSVPHRAEHQSVNDQPSPDRAQRQRPGVRFITARASHLQVNAAADRRQFRKRRALVPFAPERQRRPSASVLNHSRRLIGGNIALHGRQRSPPVGKAAIR